MVRSRLSRTYLLCFQLLWQDVWMCRIPDQEGKSICLWSECWTDQRIQRNFNRTWKEQSIPWPYTRRELTVIPRDEGRKIPRWKQSSSCQDRYDIWKYQHEGSNSLSYRKNGTSQYRKQMVYLSNVRFCSSIRGCIWRGNTLYLYTGIWRSQTTVWLGC